MKKLRGSLALAAIAVALPLTFSLSMGVPSVSASEARKGQLHVTKDCPLYTGAAGDYCTIKTSNLAEIKPGSNVYYDQAAGTPAGFLDSNIVLNVGTGDWAVGRCTLDSTNSGLCTFSDGTGPLAGFTARVKVSPLGGTLYGWDGTYSFNSLPDR